MNKRLKEIRMLDDLDKNETFCDYFVGSIDTDGAHDLFRDYEAAKKHRGELLTMIDERDKRITRMEAQIERVQWQPIETAPKDGTVIDLWVKAIDHEFRAVDFRWDDREPDWVHDGTDHVLSDTYMGVGLHAIYWKEPQDVVAEIVAEQSILENGGDHENQR